MIEAMLMLLLIILKLKRRTKLRQNTLVAKLFLIIQIYLDNPLKFKTDI